MKRLFPLLMLLWSCQMQAQSLSRADLVQLENQAAFLLTQEYYASFKTLVTVPDNGDYEMAMSKVLTKAVSTNSKVWNDYTNQRMSFRDYLADLRRVNRGTGGFAISGTSYQREAAPRLIDGDSLLTRVYVQQVTRDVRGTHTTPVVITLVGRLRRDGQNQLGYFYNLRIGLIEKGTAPANAVAFSTDIRDKKNPFQTYLAEQTLGVVLQKVTNDLVKALPEPVKRLGLSGFTYKKCGIHDVFSTELLATLQTNLTNARQGLQPSPSEKEPAGYQIKGSYETAGNFFKLSADVLNQTGTVVAHVDNTDLPLSWFAANQRTFIPVEYAKTQAENKTIQPFLSDDRELTMDINTGRSNQVFYKGEIMTLKVRTNKAAHVRALYRNADNELVWLGDREVKASEVNLDVELSRAQCAAPFGVERLIVVASTEPMCALDINPDKMYMVNIYKQSGETTDQAVNKAFFQALKTSRDCTRTMLPGNPHKVIKQIIITTKDKVL